MSAQDFQRARSVLPEAGISELCRAMHVALSCAWADHPEANADQLLDDALDAMPDTIRDQAAPVLSRAQLDLLQQQVEKRSLTILYR